VVSAVTGAVLEVIRTGHSYQSHLIEVGACAVKRKGGAGWKNHFYLTEDRISFLARTVDSSSDTVRIWSFPLTIQTTRPLADPPVIAGSTPLVQTVGRPIQSNPTLRHSAVASLGHTNRILLLLSQSPFSLGPMSTLSLFSLDCGELTMEIPWPGQDLGLSGLTNTRALLHTETSIHFFSLTAGETVQTFTHQQLATEFRLPEVERWSGVMECNPEVRQFVLHTPSLSAYRILQYEEKEMAIPTIVLQGSNLAEAMEGMGASVRLVSGCLVTNKSRELATSFPGSMGGMEEGRVACHEIAAYSLASGVRHSLLAMGADREAAAKAELLLNHLSVRWWDDRNQRCLAQKTLWNPERRPVFVISPSLMGVLLESGTEIRLVDFTPSIQEVARQEGDWLLKQEMEEKKEGNSVRMEE